jgi:hypothetical protein
MKKLEKLRNIMVSDAFMMKKAGKAEKYNGFHCFWYEKSWKS